MKTKYLSKRKLTFPIYFSGGLKLLDNIGKPTRSMRKIISFTSLENYDKNDKHILYGFTVGNTRIYLKWSYEDFLKRVSLVAVIEETSKSAVIKSSETKLGSLEFNRPYITEITLDLTGRIVFYYKDLFNKYTYQKIFFPCTIRSSSYYISRSIFPKHEGKTIASIRIKDI